VLDARRVRAAHRVMEHRARGRRRADLPPARRRAFPAAPDGTAVRPSDPLVAQLLERAS
jgi:hypothetical protein